MKKLLPLSMLTAAILAPSAFAEDEVKPFEVSAEAGVLITTGNTESSSYFGNVTVVQNLDEWKNTFTFDILKKENETENAAGNTVTETTDDRYTLSAQGDYKIAPKSALFVFGSYTNDEFGAYEKYSTVAAGYSFRALQKDNMYLDVNVGPGYTSAETQEGETEDGFVGRASGAFQWKVSKSATFVQNVSLEYADFNTRTITETALKTTLTDMMKMKVSYKTITNSDVAPGLDKTDTETAVTLVVNF